MRSDWWTIAEHFASDYPASAEFIMSLRFDSAMGPTCSGSWWSAISNAINAMCPLSIRNRAYW